MEENKAAQSTSAPDPLIQPDFSPPQPMEQPVDEWGGMEFTESEKAQITQFASQINISDSASIINYGAGAQKKIADFSQQALENVRNQDLKEIGSMLTGVVNELKQFGPEEEKGFLGFLKKGARKVSSLKGRYEKTEATLASVSQMLEARQRDLIKDTVLLDKMYDLNKTYFKELSIYIIAGKKKLEEIRTTELMALTERARKSARAEDAQEAKDLEALCTRFEKKLYDLELTRTIALQTAPQIRLVQDNNTVMVEKIQSTLTNTIPLWKNQMVIALGIAHSAQAIAAQNAVTTMTNQMLRANAEALKAATIDTAKASERGIVDIETLKATNEALISSLDEVIRIQNEGRQKRHEAELEIHRIEAELKSKLLDMSSRKT